MHRATFPRRSGRNLQYILPWWSFSAAIFPAILEQWLRWKEDLGELLANRARNTFSQTDHSIYKKKNRTQSPIHIIFLNPEMLLEDSEILIQSNFSVAMALTSDQVIFLLNFV